MFVKSRGLMVGLLALLVGGLVYCSFGPDEYAGPWPPDAASTADDSGSTDDGGG